MRTMRFHTHLMLALAGAMGLLLGLSRHWYAPAPQTHSDAYGDIGDINGPLNDLFHGVRRWVTSSDGVSGWTALHQLGVGLAAMAGIAALGALACLAPPLQAIGRDLMRYGALAAFATTVWKLLDPPGANSAFELRNGALLSAFCALVMVTGATAAANAPLRRKVPVKPYQAPLPPAAYDTSGSQAPPGS